MRKEILLVLPRVSYVAQDWPVPPIGVPYVSASMKRAGLSVHCLNLSLSGTNALNELEQAIRREHIDIVATGDLVVNYEAVKEITDCAKSISPKIITIIGGGLVTHSPEEAMQLIPSADYGVIGEGEITDCELVRTIEAGEDPAAVAGIIYRDGTELRKTAPRPAIEDLDSLPWPDYEGFQYFEAARRWSVNGKLAAPLTTSRSCPFRCTFCSTSGGEKKYRQRSLNSIFEELQYLVEHYHVEEVFLNDELFAVDENRVHEFCRRITPFQVKWYMYLRVGKHIQLQLLQEMHASGCVTVFYGLESASNRILKSMKKGITAEEILRVLKITKEAGIKAQGGFIFGDTEESLETAEYTLHWTEQHSDLLESVYFSPIVLYPGSELYARAVASGKIPDTVQFIRDHCPLVNPSEMMTEAEYHQLINERLPAFAAQFLRKTDLQSMEQLQERIRLDRQRMGYRYKLRCKECGQEIEELIYPANMTVHNVTCPTCGKRYSKLRPGIVLLQQYEQDFSKLLQRDTYANAIWCMGQIAEDFYFNNSFFRETDGLVLIDNSPAKQQIGFHGKPVSRPDILYTRQFSTVLCMDNNVAIQSIRKQVREMGLESLRVLGLYEVLLDEGT